MMTLLDRDIIKAFECCMKRGFEPCYDCPLKEVSPIGTKSCKDILNEKLFDLIKRQQAEIERYKTLYEDLKAENLETIKAIKDYKTEATKDFVHYFFDECVTFDNGVTILVDKEDFDNLVKEMTEGKNE